MSYVMLYLGYVVSSVCLSKVGCVTDLSLTAPTIIQYVTTHSHLNLL